MKRREMFRAFAGLVGAVRMWPAGDQRVRHYYGRITVESHLFHQRTTGEILHVFYEGHDVTAHSYEADDSNGYVFMFCPDRENHQDWTKSGAHHLNPNHHEDVCRMKLYGRVVIAPGGP